MNRIFEKKIEANYLFNHEELCKLIKMKGYKFVVLQVPDGLKIYARGVADQIAKNTNANVIISADPCYGACDLATDFKDLGVELLIHFGHSKIPKVKSRIPVYYVELQSKLDVIPVVNKSLKYLEKKVGLVTTVQHINKLKEVSKFLIKKGIRPVIGEGNHRITYSGQVLGCNFSTATSISKKVGCFLFIGSGNFHPLGIAIATKKKVVIADPYLNEIRDIEAFKNSILKQRFGAITGARTAKSFGILISTKAGQMRIELAKKLKAQIESKNRKAYLIGFSRLEPENLKAFEIDVFVSVACPRIAMDDYLKFSKPILTPMELEIILGTREWEDYKLDEIT